MDTPQPSQSTSPVSALASLAEPAEGPDSALVAQASSATVLNARLAPQNLEAERSVLGGILLTNESFYDVMEIVKPEDFYREPHRKIFAAMIELANRNEPIDLITLADQLRKSQELDDVGGSAYIASLDAAVPASANLSRYARIVREKALARRVIEAAHTIAREGYEQKGDIDEYLDTVEQRIFDITEMKTASAFHALKDSVTRVFKNLEHLFHRQDEITGTATGFTNLDSMTSGLQKGDLIIVAARPSMGKTSLVMNMAGHAAIELNRPVAVFSLEMGADALTTRLLASEARVDSQRLRNGKLLETDWPKLARAADRLHRAPLFIDDTAGIGALEVRAKCRRLKAQQKDLALVVIDYLQLMKGRPGVNSREQEISEISRGLKALARELEVPVVALSQLNRSLERREDKRPMMSDLRESGAIEQDADVIAFIYRDEYYNPESQDEGVAEVIIGKQRNGPTGTARLAFLKDYTRFENLADEDAYGHSDE